MQVSFRQVLAATVAVGALAATSACGGEDVEEVASASGVTKSAEQSAEASPSTSDSASPRASASASTSASPSPSGGSTASATPSRTASGDHSGSDSSGGGSGGTSAAAGTSAGPDFPVPVTVGDATQLITVDSNGSYATVTAWAKGASGWKSAFSTSQGRVGSNGVVPGSSRQQGTWTTPGGTYTLTEGFGVEASSTSMPYTVVDDRHWWVQDPESKFYNQMHTAEGADFPLQESGERGSEHLVNYPDRYANALVVDFNRRPAVRGRGAGIFLHINGSGATAGCVSVPRATMDRIMAWIEPGNHPRIAID
ncbi:L,D-transpeptidase family protein [Streptomyces sp. TR02-1]|uniref:L,D-transpeptidase family protein n=1 Tax=Streptomyces sp. TR02-1 TaxID=3385977 RepID=UPI00399EEE07